MMRHTDIVQVPAGRPAGRSVARRVRGRRLASHSRVSRRHGGRGVQCDGRPARGHGLARPPRLDHGGPRLAVPCERGRGGRRVGWVGWGGGSLRGRAHAPKHAARPVQDRPFPDERQDLEVPQDGRAPPGRVRGGVVADGDPVRPARGTLHSGRAFRRAGPQDAMPPGEGGAPAVACARRMPPGRDGGGRVAGHMYRREQGMRTAFGILRRHAVHRCIK